MRHSEAIHLYGIIKSPSTLVLRLFRGWTSQGELATKLNVNQSAITEWESGRKGLTPGHMMELAKHYMAWTHELGWPGLDILIAAITRERKGKPWHTPKSTQPAKSPQSPSTPSRSSRSARRKTRSSS